MNEIWKDVIGYEGYYQVSNLGRVRSIDRYVTQPLTQYGVNATRLLKGKILKLRSAHFGYYTVELNKNHKRKLCYVHRLVAEAFIPNPNNLPSINHIDFNGSNNIVDNLEWVTQKQNAIHSLKRLSGRQVGKSGYKYIFKNKKSTYTVIINVKPLNLRYWRTFKTLEEAINDRNKKIKDIGLETRLPDKEPVYG